MKFKRIISAILLICIIFSVTACKSGADVSKKIVDNLMAALTEYDVNAISNCIEDFPDNTGTPYIHDIYTEDYYRDLYVAANESLTYTIKSATAKEVVLNVTMPDLYSLYQEIFTAVVSQAFTNTEVNDYILNPENDSHLMVIALMINEIENNGVDTIEKEIKLSVSKINDKFKIKTDDQLKMLLSDGLSQIQIENVATEE